MPKKEARHEAEENVRYFARFRDFDLGAVRRALKSVRPGTRIAEVLVGNSRDDFFLRVVFDQIVADRALFAVFAKPNAVVSGWNHLHPVKIGPPARRGAEISNDLINFARRSAKV